MGFFKTLKGGPNEFGEETEMVPELELEEEETMEERTPSFAKSSSQTSAYAPQVKADTVISKGMTLTGTLKGKGTVRVEGIVEGEISLDGALTVAVSGTVKGPVAVNVLRVAGNIEGNATVKDHLCLERTGHIQGDIETVSLVIEDGGRLNGRTTMMERPKDHQPPAEPKAPPVPELEFGPNYPGGWDTDDTAESAQPEKAAANGKKNK